MGLENLAQAGKAVPAKIKVRKRTKSSIVITCTLVTLLLLTVYTFTTFGSKEIDLAKGMTETFANIKTMFLEPRLQHFTLADAFIQVTVTMGLAFLTTLIGAIIALFFGLLAAENLSSGRWPAVIKGAVAFIRAVPTVLWVLIFAVSAGLGSVAAVVGMTFHTVGYLIKAYSESFEEMDNGVIEAMKASGASWWQTVFQAVLPSSAAYIISWTFLRFEVNFAVAVAMGAAAGAGGIGYDMFMASNFYYDLREVGVITFFILGFAILLELAAGRIKKMT
ncbi:ABC transporter permease subunit [Bacillus mangrovi]|uniref:ABC transporter permease subunit n=1 Tax=Metabacillus mangrovi TaxID=1491830 RepID=A0A7X2V4Z0_9BACI|nr:ABC transporter permease subunit [Metabacillus mangrovi]MTH53503.1 ABC transporter permease subunit [Metabacillus mangrovi]